MKINIYGFFGSCLVWCNIGDNYFELLDVKVGQDVGMIKVLFVLDIDGNGWLDILLAGEYMFFIVLYNENGNF